MKVAEEFRLRWQPFRRVGFSEYVTRSGAYCDLVVFEAPCAECGREFEARATKTFWKRREVSRRCPCCRRPGVPVPHAPPKPSVIERFPGWAFREFRRWELKERAKQRAKEKRLASEQRGPAKKAPAALPDFLL